MPSSIPVMPLPFCMPIHQEPAIPVRVSEWIQYIERQRSNERRIEAIKTIPTIYLSNEDFALSLWSVRLKNCFKHFNLKEMTTILEWLFNDVSLLWLEADEDAVADRISCKRSLFVAFRAGLEDKALLDEFFESDEFLFLQSYLL